tara:strand:+ start:371 stop:751 length:381 start_codon:yes stop_codon:yes gene_type:complete
MANFAKMDENNLVVDVIKIHNNDLLDENGEESEALGIAFCKSLFGEDTEWIQTSWNHNVRGSFAGIGWSYNSELDIFCEPLPFPSWTNNELTGRPEAPVPFPSEGEWIWNEEEQKWDEYILAGERE